jgi:DNA uptake protein ComE-like DNA-binding protein
MKKPVPILVALTLAVAALAGCAADTPQSAAGQTNDTSTSTSAPAPGSSAAPAGAVDPNSASTDELVAALESAGVDNAQQWAREIQEYGPYTAADLTATLTQELAKYNIAADQLTKLLSALDVS